MYIIYTIYNKQMNIQYGKKYWNMKRLYCRMARDDMQGAMDNVNSRIPYQDESDFAILLQYYCNNIAKSEACAYGTKFLVRNFAIGFNCKCNCKWFCNYIAIKVKVEL